MLAEVGLTSGSGGKLTLADSRARRGDRDSLSLKLVPLVAVPVIVGLGLVILTVAYLSTQQVRNEEELEARAIAGTLKNELVRVALTGDAKAAQDATSHMGHFAELLRAELVRADGAVLLTYEADGGDARQDSPGEPADDVRSLRLEFPLSHEDKVVATLVMEHSLEAADAAARSAAWTAGSVLLIGLGVGIALMIRLRRAVVTPLRALSERAARLGDGDLDSEIQGDGPAEIGQLAAALEGMRRNLQSSYAEVTRKNQELAEAGRLREAAATATALRAMFDQAPYPIISYDSNGLFLDANESACQLYGRTWEQLVGGHAMEDFLPAADRQMAREDLAVLAAVGHLRTDARVLRPNGVVRTVEIVARANVTPGTHIAALRDTTDERLEADTLRGLAAGLAGRTGDALFSALALELSRVVGAEFVMVARVHGKDRDMIHSLAVARDGAPAGPVCLAIGGSVFSEVVSGGLSLNVRERAAEQHPGDPLLRELGAEYCITRPLVASGGGVLGLLVVVGKSRMPAEERVRRLADIFAARASAELARSDSDSKATAAEEKLQTAQRLQSLGQLAGGIAHDFNNLLTIIACNTEMLLSGAKLGAQHSECVQQIGQASARAADLTKQLLAFSRRQILAPVVLDLNEVVREAELMLRRLLREDVTLHVDLEERLPQVLMDRGQLVQVLVNLAVNARDAMPSGGTLTIETRSLGLSSSSDLGETSALVFPHVVVRVRDTGTGMDAATQARLFEPFFTTKEVGKGTGLGLATVHGIVAQSQGRIRVKSALGVGTTIEIVLPVARETPLQGAVSAQAAISHSGGPESVLVVEDESAVRRVTTAILQDKGYRVASAADGRDALKIASDLSRPLDILVTDVVMPGLGGRALAEHLRVQRPDLRVLFVTGYTDDPVLRSGVQDATTMLLMKPFTPASLLRAVRRLLDAGSELPVSQGK